MERTAKIAVCRADDLEDGDVRGLVIDGCPVALYRVAGEYFATHNVCTHEYALLSDGYLEGHVIECPLHAGTFDVKTGAALAAPCTKALRRYPIEIVDGQVLIAVEE